MRKMLDYRFVSLAEIRGFEKVFRRLASLMGVWSDEEVLCGFDALMSVRNHVRLTLSVP